MASDPPATIDDDVQCVHCGYNLRTMPVDGDCPECGAPVEETLHPPKTMSPRERNMLRFLYWLVGGQAACAVSGLIDQWSVVGEWLGLLSMLCFLAFIPVSLLLALIMRDRHAIARIGLLFLLACGLFALVLAPGLAC
jgi:hypothetical protein